MKRTLSSVILALVLAVATTAEAKRGKGKHVKAARPAPVATAIAPTIMQTVTPIAAPTTASRIAALAEGESIEEEVVFDDAQKGGSIGALPEYKFNGWLLALPMGLMLVFTGNVGWRKKTAVKKAAMDMEANTIPVFVQQAKKRANKKSAKVANSTNSSGSIAHAS